MPETPQQRFLKLGQVAEELNITANQVYALVRRSDLEAIKIGGRGQWRVERYKLEEYIERTYEETRAFIEAHPLQEDATPELGMDEAPEPLIRGPRNLKPGPAKRPVDERDICFAQRSAAGHGARTAVGQSDACGTSAVAR